MCLLRTPGHRVAGRRSPCDCFALGNDCVESGINAPAPLPSGVVLDLGQFSLQESSFLGVARSVLIILSLYSCAVHRKILKH